MRPTAASSGRSARNSASASSRRSISCSRRWKRTSRAGGRPGPIVIPETKTMRRCGAVPAARCNKSCWRGEAMSMHEPRIVLIAGVWLATAAAANAAAEPTSQAGGLEEVIVTAQKRSESEQSVPMSMTTFSSAALEQKSITSFYIDDVILPDSLDPRVLDIDHIEVLRGPQGTLYGARSMGGTVRLITKDPDMERFSATLHGGVSNTDRTDSPNYTADGILNTPLGADWIALRLTGFYDDQAGYFKRS